MKYVKYFESFDPDQFDPDIIAKNLKQYCEEWPKTNWSHTLSILGIDNDKPSLSEIQNGIENLIDEAKGKNLKTFLRDYESLIKNGKLHISLEEIEDLFLDIPEYTITKSNKFDSSTIFNILVDIKNVAEKDLQYTNNHIYGTVKSRLPDTVYIKRVTVLMDDDGKYDIKIRLFESRPKASEDAFINILTNALRNVRRDDPDYEG